MTEAKARVQESEFYLGERSLYVSVYDSGASRWLVMVPPLFEELARTRKLLVNASRRFAAAGINVIRFDYYGTGLSEGRFEDFAPSQARRDLEAVVGYCRDRGAKQIALLGIRYGGYLAAELARRGEFDRVVLWEPVTDPSAYMTEFIKSTAVDQILTYGEVRFDTKELMVKLAREGRMLISGYALAATTVDELLQAKALERGDCEKLAIVLWRRSTLNKTPFLAELNPVVVPNVKVAWDHIKFFDHEAKEVVDATLGLLGCQ